VWCRPAYRLRPGLGRRQHLEVFGEWRGRIGQRAVRLQLQSGESHRRYFRRGLDRCQGVFGLETHRGLEILRRLGHVGRLGHLQWRCRVHRLHQQLEFDDRGGVDGDGGLDADGGFDVEGGGLWGLSRRWLDDVADEAETPAADRHGE
jgi:hypothetical protein